MIATSTELLQILSSLESKSSGWGMSYYGTRCPRKARLDREFPSESSFEARVGTIFHKLEELWYTGALANIALPLSDNPEDCKEDPVQEALRCFFNYIKVFPKNEFTTLGCEVLFPRKEEEIPLIAEAVGVTPFTGRIDRVVYASEVQAQEASKRRCADIRPGYYLVDTKTTEKRAMDAYLKYELADQFTAYQLVWQKLNPELKLNGMLVNNIIRHQDMTKRAGDEGWRSFRTFVISPPSEVNADGLRAWLKWKAEDLKTDRCDRSTCSDYGGCIHYKTGNCNRI